MSDSINNYAINLLILGISIVLILVLYQKVSFSDSFVGKVPLVPIGNGPFVPYMSNLPMGGYPTGQPMTYSRQLYEAKYPYYNDSINHVGRPCNSATGCGVLGACVKGVCKVKNENDTVFNVKV